MGWFGMGRWGDHGGGCGGYCYALVVLFGEIGSWGVEELGWLP